MLSRCFIHAGSMVFLALLSLTGGPPAIAETIVVGGEAGYAPYESFDESGEPHGFNIDLMRAIAQATGNEAQFRLGEWEAMRGALQSGEVDVLGMFVSAQRRRDVDFARPHLIVNHRIFIPAGGRRISRVEDLAGLDVIVQKQAWSHEYLLKSGIELSLTLVETDTEGLRLLARGQHDAALLTEHRSRHTLATEDLDSLTVSGPPVLPVEYALAVRKGNDDLLATINDGIDRVMASGAFDRIYERWLQPFERPDASRALSVTLPAVVIAVVLLLVCAWLLRKLVNSRRDSRRARQELDYLREHDALTGLLSRHALEQAVAGVCREAPDDEHSLLYINVDQFRLFNEALGHDGADRILRTFSGHLKGAFPTGTTIARMGADEFAVLLDRTGLQTAERLGQALLDSLDDNPIRATDDGRRVTASIGVVSFGGEDGQVAAILRRADCACLAAKEDGGNQVHAWQPDDQRLAEKLGELSWVTRIQSALADGRMTMYWQPIVAVNEADRRSITIELLARLQPSDPRNDPIPAGRFMPAAERYFITPEIDRWSFGHVLDWMEYNAALIDQLERVNVNLSGRSLGDPAFLSFLEARIDRNPALLPKLCIEVTETALISNLEKARETLKRLHDGGCRIALDDFGTGVSSMNYLRELPVDYLKIDGSFVKDIDLDSEACRFIEQINRLGHTMGKTTIAECVETESVRRQLEAAGIDLVQGYLFGRPRPLSELEGYLAETHAAHSGAE
ncbi:MAG: EAL domain-containing protein [Gammaproteobacteria bacterium]|nr:EAL domain-containing protein [Gammaproteobacteria bacterium]